MERYKRFYGIIVFLFIIGASIFGAYSVVMPKIERIKSLGLEIEKQENILAAKTKEKRIVEEKLKKIQDFLTSSQKKIYSPIESDLGNDTLFFTLYNDVLDMFHSNAVRIKSLNYTYNPSGDKFVDFGKDVYFVCDLNMELVSDYVNLGKVIQDIYQYPYYIKINEIKVKPYSKDKKILLTNMTLRLYSHTDPEVVTSIPEADTKKK